MAPVFLRWDRCAWVGKLPPRCWWSPPWKAARATEALQPHAGVSPPLGTEGRCVWGSPVPQACIGQGAPGERSRLWRKLMWTGQGRFLYAQENFSSHPPRHLVNEQPWKILWILRTPVCVQKDMNGTKILHVFSFIWRVPLICWKLWSWRWVSGKRYQGNKKVRAAFQQFCCC